MIKVTEEAKVLLKSVKHSEEAPEETVLRLDPVKTHPAKGEGQIGLSYGEPREDDEVVEHEEREMLRIAWPVSEDLNGSTLHLVQTSEGQALVLEPPADGSQPISDGS